MLPVTEFELETVMALQASVFYISARRWLYTLPVPKDVDAVLTARVVGFADTAPPKIAAYLASLQSVTMAGD